MYLSWKQRLALEGGHRIEELVEDLEHLYVKIKTLDFWGIDTLELMWKYEKPLWEEEESELSGNLWIGGGVK